ncbi:hypothetical protein NMG60_11029948 [Bertholletia excelsa]
MAIIVSSLRLIPFLSMAMIVLIVPTQGQIPRPPCTPTMLTTFAPCMTFVTNNSTNNGTNVAPSAACCSSLRSLARNGTDCFCFIATGSPFQIPVNRTLAISLPRACNMPGVPLQCKASAAPVTPPVAAPGPNPIPLTPTLPPEAAAPLSPKASGVPQPGSPAQTPESDGTPESSPPPTGTSQAPTANSGIRPVVNPPASGAGPARNFSPALLLALLVATLLRNY